MPSCSINWEALAREYCAATNQHPDQPMGVEFKGFKTDDPNHNPWPFVYRWQHVAADLKKHHMMNLVLNNINK